MTRYSTCFRTLLALLIVLAGVSASQAGLFARWRARNYPAAAPTAVSTQQATTTPAAGQPSVSPAGPVVYTVAKPVVGENTSAPAYAPRASSGSTWSTLPRSSWDFGKFPPYSN